MRIAMSPLVHPRRILAGFCVIVAAGLAPAAGNQTPKAPGDGNPPMDEAAFEQAVNTALGLRASEVVTINVDLTPQVPLLVAVAIGEERYTLDLAPHSLRTDDFRLLVQGADGRIVAVESGPVRTLRGSVLEVPGSEAAGSMLEEGLHATIRLPGGDQYWIQPVAPLVAEAGGDVYVVYHNNDVIGLGGRCGLDDPAFAKNLRLHEPAAEPEAGLGGGEYSCTELACDADVEYFQDWEASVPAVQARIESVINTVNFEYATQTDITHVLTAILVRTAEPDPYSSTSSLGLLTQFRNEWLQNQGGIRRDVAHLFTGKNIDGGTIGRAWMIGGICTSGAYAFSQSDCCSPNYACATDLTAHEIGHLWGAFHCSCPGFTMHTPLQCANVFSQGSINSIVAHRNSRTCLEDCDEPVGFPVEIATGPSTAADAYLRLAPDPFGSWADPSFGGGGDLFNPVGGAPAQPATFTAGFLLFEGNTKRVLLSNSGNWQFTFDFDGSLERAITAASTAADTNADNVDDTLTSSFDVFGGSTSLTFDLEQHVENVVPLGGDPVAVLTQAYTITNNSLSSVDFVLTRAYDGDLIWSGDFSNDSVGTGTNGSPGDRYVYMVDGSPTAAVTVSSPQGDAYYGAKRGVTPPGGPPFGFGTDDEVWNAYGIPTNWRNHIAGVGSNTNGESGPSPAGCVSRCDGAVGLDIPVSLAGLASTTITIRHTFGATTPGIEGGGCPWDLDGDDTVGVGDLLALFAVWGPCPGPPGCPGDFNSDGFVGVGDMLAMFANWGPCS